MRQLLLLALLGVPAFGQIFPASGGPHIAHVGGGGACTPASGYAHCRVLTADHTQMGGSTLLSFAARVSTTLGAGRILNASCFDVVFTSDSAGTSKIPWEQESCTQSTGAIIDWVLCASCSSTVDTLLYMSYGNAGATVAQNTGLNGPTYVWDGNYKGVWHVAGSGSMGDSTANGNTFTNNAATSAAGQIDGAVAFSNSTNYLTRPALVSGPNVTISAWVYATSLAGPDLVLNEQADGNLALDNWQLALAPGGTGSAPRFLMFSGASVYSVSASANAAINTWYHLAASYDGATLRIYVNGVVASVYAGVVMNSNTAALWIGRLVSGSYNFLGTVDEIRISNTARPSGQITAEVNSQKTGSTFLTVGAEI